MVVVRWLPLSHAIPLKWAVDRKPFNCPRNQSGKAWIKEIAGSRMQTRGILFSLFDLIWRIRLLGHWNPTFLIFVIIFINRIFSSLYLLVTWKVCEVLSIYIWEAVSFSLSLSLSLPLSLFVLFVSPTFALALFFLFPLLSLNKQTQTPSVVYIDGSWSAPEKWRPLFRDFSRLNF